MRDILRRAGISAIEADDILRAERIKANPAYQSALENKDYQTQRNILRGEGYSEAAIDDIFVAATGSIKRFRPVHTLIEALTIGATSGIIVYFLGAKDPLFLAIACAFAAIAQFLRQWYRSR